MSLDALPIRDAVAPDDVSHVVRRSHGLRTLGLALGTIMVGVVLYQHGAPLSVWTLLLLYGFVWPHIAWLALRRSTRPIAGDQRWLLADAAMGGVWIALMQFNVLPSVLLAVMMAMTLVAIGGGPMLLRGLAIQAVACCVAAVVNGLAFAPATRMPEMLASLPLLVVFPMTLSIIMHGLAKRVQRQNRVLLQMSSIDGLSGLLNRKHWEDAASVALAGNHRGGAVMLLIDIDHFKRVNDQHGHTVGDEAIRLVGAIIRSNLREGDLAGRYGGDEFGVVLCGAGAEAAAIVAERIRSGVACTLFKRVPGLRCTLSIGLAPSRAELRNAREWIKDADAALYRAKLAGRNRLVVVT